MGILHRLPRRKIEIGDFGTGNNGNVPLAYEVISGLSPRKADSISQSYTFISNLPHISLQSRKF